MEIQKKEKVHCLQNPSFSHFFWAYGPRGNSREFFLEVLGSDGKSMEINTHTQEKPMFSRDRFIFVPGKASETSPFIAIPDSVYEVFV